MQDLHLSSWHQKDDLESKSLCLIKFEVLECVCIVEITSFVVNYNKDLLATLCFESKPKSVTVKMEPCARTRSRRYTPSNIASWYTNSPIITGDTASKKISGKYW